jgi:two-component system cell cycle response regulator DivK
MPTSQPVFSATPYRILIVEDHALVAKFYRLALERAGGFTCQISEDVPEILAAVEGGRADLAILDISLRGSELEGRPVDGLELAQLLKQRSPRPLPIILATAHAMVGDRERLLAASGADAYLEKPIYDAEQLVGLVRRLLAKRDASASSPSS